MGSGTAAGANNAYQPALSYPGTPASWILGKSGMIGTRCFVVTARARTLPDLTKGTADEMPAISIVTSPLIRPIWAGPAPLYGTYVSLILAMYAKSAVVRWMLLPTPPVPARISPGRLRASANNSFTLFTGSDG